MISQLTVFLQNEKGRLSGVCSAIAEANINMHALFLADTTDFGIARIFCDTPDEAVKVLDKAGFRSTLTPVIAVKVPNVPGGLAKLLKFCDEENLNIEYGYCFSVNDDAIDVLKIEQTDSEERLAKAGFNIVSPEEIYAV